MRCLYFTLLAALFLATSCNEQEKVEEAYRPTDAYDAYVHGLKQARLTRSALGSKWFTASETAVKDPVRVPIPYAESFYIPSNEPTAVGLRFSAKRGQRVEIDLEKTSDEEGFVFVDLFRVVSDSLGQYVHVATADSVQNELDFEPQAENEYILRIIPELLTGGRFNLRIRNLPILAFPVKGKDKWAIQSRFGVAREGGRREHHGVDIFAKRHTPVIAPVSGRIRNVDTTNLGGHVIWLRDSRGHNLYFAHLQDQLVRSGDTVQAGDTIGTVGNTGNARTTPPHLHFGIYSRGPVDPYDFIVPVDTVADDPNGNQDLLGKWARNRQTVSLRSNYGNKFEVITDYEVNTALYVDGIAGNYYRVRQADGTRGYVLARVIEPVDKPLEKWVMEKHESLFHHPGSKVAFQTIRPGEEVELLGKYHNYLLVRTTSGKSGWFPS